MAFLRLSTHIKDCQEVAECMNEMEIKNKTKRPTHYQPTKLSRSYEEEQIKQIIRKYYSVHSYITETEPSRTKVLQLQLKKNTKFVIVSQCALYNMMTVFGKHCLQYTTKAVAAAHSPSMRFYLWLYNPSSNSLIDHRSGRSSIERKKKKKKSKNFALERIKFSVGCRSSTN